MRVGDPRQEAGLQAADLVAYEFRKFCEIHAAEQSPNFRWPFAQLLEMEHVLPYLDGGELRAIFRRNNAGSRNLMVSVEGIRPWDPVAALKRLSIV